MQLELIGSFAINFLTFNTRIRSDLSGTLDALQIGLVYGFATLTFIVLMYPSAKCHFTPILTLADMAFKGLDLRQGVMLMLCQFVGCVLSTGLIMLTLSQEHTEAISQLSVAGMPHLRQMFSHLNGFIAEFIFSAILGYSHAQFSERSKTIRSWVEFYAGVRCMILILAALNAEPVSGVSLNPFTILSASMISAMSIRNQWIYLIAPCVGVYVGSFLRKKFIDTKFIVE